MIILPNWLPQPLLMAIVLVLVIWAAYFFEPRFKIRRPYAVLLSLFYLSAGAFIAAPLAHMILLGISLGALIWAIVRRDKSLIFVSFILTVGSFVFFASSSQIKCLFFQC